jgi:hypothetical protein
MSGSGLVSMVWARAINLLVAVAPGAARIAGSALVFVLAIHPAVGMLPGRVDPRLVQPYVQRQIHNVQEKQQKEVSGLATRLVNNAEPKTSCTMVWNQTPVISRAMVLVACQRLEAGYQAVSGIVARVAKQVQDPGAIRVPPVSPRRPLPPIDLPVRFDTGCMASSMGARYCGFIASGSGGIEGMGANWTAFVTRGNQTFVYNAKTMATVLSDALTRGDFVFLDAGAASMSPTIVRAGPEAGVATRP